MIFTIWTIITLIIDLTLKHQYNKILLYFLYYLNCQKF